MMENLEFNPEIDFAKVGISISEIQDLLPEEWKTKIKDVYLNSHNDNQVELYFVVAVKTVDEVKQWLHDFEEKNKCSYSIRSTDQAKGQRVLFRQRLRCQHNTGNKNMFDPLVRNRSRNSNCPSTVYCKLRAVHKRYRGKNKSKAPDPEMPFEVRLAPNHNHSTADALRFRQVNEETKQKLINLFKSGHSAATALATLKMDIQMENENYEEILADRGRCPAYTYCYHLYLAVYKEKEEPKLSSKFLLKKIEEYNNENGAHSAQIQFIGDEDYVMCLCPPLMQRVHETVEEASEIVFMDSTGMINKAGNRVFLLLTASDCGGLPLAIFITSSERSELIAAGFQLLRALMGENIFHGAIDGPNVFMTDDLEAERDAIEAEWPKSMHFLCIYQVLQSIYTWTIKPKNGVKQEHQRKIWQQFKRILYANTEYECATNFQIAYDKSTEYTQYKKFLETYWAQRQYWALCYRNDFYTENKMSEAIMRLLKGHIFDKIKKFNFMQVIDFMMTKFVTFYEKILLDVAHNNTEQNILQRLISPPPKDIVERISRLTDGACIVPSDKMPNFAYIVNPQELTCTCDEGTNGYMCSHICWVCLMDSNKLIKNLDNDELRRKYHYIVTGGITITEPGSDPLSDLVKEAMSDDDNIDDDDNDYDDIDYDDNDEDDDDEDEEIIEIVTEESNVDMTEFENEHLAKGINFINLISEKFLNLLKESPSEISNALEVFNEQLQEINNASEFEAACDNFAGIYENASIRTSHSIKQCDSHIDIKPSIKTENDEDFPAKRKRET